MIRIQLAPAEKDKCINFLIHILIQERVQQRIKVLHLVNQGVILKEFARLCNLSQNTITDYIKFFGQRGTETSETLSCHQPVSVLQEHQVRIQDYFQENPPLSIKEARGKIEELTGLKRSETQIRKFLTDVGISFRKVGVVPAKVDVDVEKQETFKKKNWNLDYKKPNKEQERFILSTQLIL